MIYQEEPLARRDAIERLEGYLINPGRFSILILGAHGTGKTYWLKTLQQLHRQKDCLEDCIIINAAIAKHMQQEYWEEQFKKANGKLLVIEDVENLSRETQETLFEGLSTGEGGKYGFDQKVYDIRVAFTSSKSITALRDYDILSNRFFDRISQFIVTFPECLTTKDGIWEDFKKSWAKMSFQEENKIPDRLKNWLEGNTHRFNGNFRDLDKIAINWHNYRLIGKAENEILRLLIKDFDTNLHYPAQDNESAEVFMINKEEGFAGNLQLFKSHYKAWLNKQYGSYKNKAAIKKAGRSSRTMESW
ncbi:MAG: ATP-binding protein [Flammeovirgaceae bacterium]